MTSFAVEGKEISVGVERLELIRKKSKVIGDLINELGTGSVISIIFENKEIVENYLLYEQDFLNLPVSTLVQYLKFAQYLIDDDMGIEVSRVLVSPSKILEIDVSDLNRDIFI